MEATPDTQKSHQTEEDCHRAALACSEALNKFFLLGFPLQAPLVIDVAAELSSPAATTTGGLHRVLLE